MLRPDRRRERAPRARAAGRGVRQRELRQPDHRSRRRRSGSSRRTTSSRASTTTSSGTRETSSASSTDSCFSDEGASDDGGGQYTLRRAAGRHATADDARRSAAIEPLPTVRGSSSRQPLTSPDARVGQTTVFPVRVRWQDVSTRRRAAGRRIASGHGTTAGRAAASIAVGKTPCATSGTSTTFRPCRSTTSGTTQSVGHSATDKIYVVQTNTKVDRALHADDAPIPATSSSTRPAALARRPSSPSSGAGAGSRRHVACRARARAPAADGRASSRTTSSPTRPRGTRRKQS